MTSAQRRIRARLFVGAVLAAAGGFGCAAIADLDQTYTFTPDGGGGEPNDATLADGAPPDAGRDSTAPDALAPPPVDAHVDGDAEPGPSTWVLDPSFGDGGFLLLPGVLPTDAPPMVEVDRTNTLRVAFATANDGRLTACESPYTADAGCSTTTTYGTYPLDLISNDGGTVVALNTGTTRMAGLSFTSLWASGYVYNEMGGCYGIRTLFIDDQGDLQVLAACGTDVEVLRFGSQDMGVIAQPLYTFTDNIVVNMAAPETDAGDLWMAGSTAQYAAFAQVRADGSGAVGSGVASAEGLTAYGTDVLPTSAAHALGVGGYSGGSSGIFGLAIPAADDGGLHDLTNTYPLAGKLLIAPPLGNTRIVPVPTLPPFLVIGTAGAEIVAVAMNDDGSGGVPSPPLAVPDAGASDVLGLGNAVLFQGYVYVALSYTVSNASVPVLARLVHP